MPPASFAWMTHRYATRTIRPIVFWPGSYKMNQPIEAPVHTFEKHAIPEVQIQGAGPVAAIVHRITKENGLTVVHPRKNLLELTSQVLKLACSVAELYGSAGNKKHGIFEDPKPGVSSFSTSLEKYYKGEIDLVELSLEAANQLQEKMKDVPFAKGAYVLFFEWQSAGWRHFYVVMLTDKDGSAIDPEKLDVNDAIHIDLDKLRVAGRINFNEWIAKADKQYVSILTGRGLGDVSKYFRRFLGIDEKVDEKHETTKLIDYFKEFYREEQWSREKANAVSDHLNDHLKTLAKEQRPMFLEDISRIIDPENDTAFTNFLKKKKYEVSSEIVPHKDTLRRLVCVTGRNEHMAITFENALIGQGISFPGEKELVVRADLLPAEVVAAMRKTHGNG